MKYVIWVPAVGGFAQHSQGLFMFPTKERAEEWATLAKGFLVCRHSTPACKDCTYRVVPWDEQAQFIANGGKP